MLGTLAAADHPRIDWSALMPERLMPRVSIVTGAGSGIGHALAVELARRGSHVVVADIDGERAESAAAGLARGGLRASSATVDVADADAVTELVERTATDLGSLDLMANNAGILFSGPAAETTLRQWDRAIDVNLRGVVNGSQAAYRVMLGQGSGTILNTGSLAGLMVSPRMLPYTVTKHAVVTYSRALRIEAKPRGIDVSVVCPAFVDTPLLDEPYEATSTTGDFRQYAKRLQPRLQTPELVALRALRGVEAGKAVIPVGTLAQLLWRAERFVPRVADWGSSKTAQREDRRVAKGK